MRVLSFFTLIIFVASLAVSAHASEKPLILGIHPYLPATEIMERFGPFAEYLSRGLGKQVVIKISKNYQEHIKITGTDRYDIAFMGPVSYVKMTRLYGEKPLLARLEVAGTPTFHGVIFVSETSPVKGLSDLKGRHFAFGDQNSTMSSLVPTYMLHEAGVELKNLSGYSFISNHENVILGVLMGKYDAGAVMQDVFEAYKARGLRAIAETPQISEHLFVASKNVPNETIDKLRQIMLGMKNRQEGLKALGSIKTGITGLVPVRHSDYANLEGILAELDRIGVKY